MRNEAASIGEPLALLGAVALVLAWSAINPHDWLTWWLEVAPVLIGAPILIWSFPRFRLSALVYRLLFLHAVILIVGGHYTYALVPVGFWFQDLLELSRNHYDRLGHLAQGFVPAMLAREILLRESPLQRGGWLFFLVVSVCLAFSAFYELIEWWAAVIGGESSQSFLGTQGDVWDSHWDMLLALTGALLALLCLSRAHDRSMRGLGIDLGKS
jgi:putative membrane protein